MAGKIQFTQEQIDEALFRAELTTQDLMNHGGAPNAKEEINNARDYLKIQRSGEDFAFIAMGSMASADGIAHDSPALPRRLMTKMFIQELASMNSDFAIRIAPKKAQQVAPIVSETAEESEQASPVVVTSKKNIVSPLDSGQKITHP